MTNDRKLSSIEASFKMENMPFDSACRRRVKNVLKNIITSMKMKVTRNIVIQGLMFKKIN